MNDDRAAGRGRKRWIRVGARVFDTSSGRIGVVLIFRDGDGETTTGEFVTPDAEWTVLRPECEGTPLGAQPWRARTDDIGLVTERRPDA